MSHWLSAVQLAVTALLLWLVMSRVDLSAVLLILKTPSGLMLLAAAVGVLLVQGMIAAARFVVMLPIFGARCGFTSAVRIWFAGLFVSQTPLTFVAGDALRIWALSALGNRVRVASLVVIFERALGFLAILLMVLCAAPLLMSLSATNVRHLVWSMTLFSGAGVAAFCAWPLLPSLLRVVPMRWRRLRAVDIALELASLMHRPLLLWRRSLLVLCLSLTMHLANIVAVYLLIGFFDARPNFFQVVAVVAPAMLLMLLPVSFAGWGVREGAMAVGLSLVGVRTDHAIAISVAFGLALLFASLPGAAVLLANRGNLLSVGIGNAAAVAARTPAVSTHKGSDEH
jgi:uncharacterized membrane protein YbhN (UPF0104 family)